MSPVNNAVQPGSTQVDVLVRRISEQTGAPVGVVRTFAKISSPENAHLFTAEAAHKAFAHVRKKA